jgi:hypothetical protein
MHSLVRWSLVASFLAAAALVALRPADACGPVMGRGAHVAVAGESAVIVWDEKAKRQHFIRRASFATQVPYFGFLVPTPTRPTIAEAPDELFSRLEDWTKPQVVVQKIPRPRGFSRGLAMKAADHPPPGGAVAVLGEGSAAGFEYKILKADDPKALEEWLQQKGYATRPELTAWLGPYVKQGWVVTAFQIAKSQPANPQVSTQAVLMSFDTPKPFFPYSEPADQRAAGSYRGGRLLRVFFVGTQRMQAALEDGKTQYPGKAEWANALADDRRTALQEKLAKTGVKLPGKPYLTVFDDPSSPRPGTSDLYFSPSADQSPVSRPPIVQYLEVDEPAPNPWLGGVVLGGTALVLAAVFAAWRFLIRPVPQAD